MHQHGKINGFQTAIWGGVTTLELAKAIDIAIDQEITGLVHLSNGVGISKYNLLLLFKKIWNKNEIEIISMDANGIDKSIMKSTHFDYTVPNYENMLIDQLHWMQNHKDLYRQYQS